MKNTCPNCGYCPHCGRANPWPVYPLNPWWQWWGNGNTWIDSTGGHNISISYTASAGGEA